MQHPPKDRLSRLPSVARAAAAESRQSDTYDAWDLPVSEQARSFRVERRQVESVRYTEYVPDWADLGSSDGAG